jgi:2-polyprenyl-6-methoxyphenol hydroxylase-like FAD-dependent oxidoreductase
LYDAIIVGARCAGAAIAMLLARSGRTVLLVDQALFPGQKTSTHLLKRTGLACLKRWGLLDRVLAAGAPPITGWKYHYDGIRITGAFHPVDGVDYELATRREVLDPLLLAAAAEAGAEVRQGFAVTQLLRDGERVVGVRGICDGQPVEEFARVVVGADGLSSRVAGEVEARVRLQEPSYNGGYYAYFEGLPPDAMLETHLLRRRQLLICFPTNHDQSVLFMFWPVERIAATRSDLTASFEQALDLAPELGKRFKQARRVSDFRGMPRFPNFVRRASGPGWALAGDAAQHRDPITACGMTQAFLDADLLAASIQRGLDHDWTLDAELAGYEARRWRMHGPSFAATVRAAQLEPLDEVAETKLRRIAAGRRTEQDNFIARLDREIDDAFGLLLEDA